MARSPGSKSDNRLALHDELELYKLVAESSSDLISVLAADGTILYASPSHERHLGLRPGELVGKNASAFAHPDDVATFATASQATSALAEHRGLVRYRHRDGHWAVVEANVSGVPANRSGAAVVVVARDVTERLAGEDALRVQEALHRALLTNGSELIAILAPSGELRYQSPSARSMFGYDSDALLGTSVFELLHPDDLEYGMRVLAEAAAAEPGATRVAEVRFRRGDGGWAVGECTVTNLIDDPAVQGLVVNTRDITERANAEAALRESERRFRATFESSLDGMLIVDDDRAFVDANPAACDLFGLTCEELVGRRFEDFTIGSLELTLQRWSALLDEGRLEGEWLFRRPDGEERLVEYRSTARMLPGRHLSVLRDITERSRLEEQLRQAQKMEAVGQLAGGVAHDFNNLLTVIAGYSALGLKRGDLAAVHSDIAQIERAAAHAAQLTQQLLAFSRRQTLHPAVVRPNELVNEAVLMLKRLVGEHIEFRVSLGPDLRDVFADATGIEQILMNLAVNAAQAMPKGGTLTIATANELLDEPTARRLEVDPGEHVALSVTDTGSGMDRQTLARAFEPFFTTKETGEGTGLGLATVHGIVKQTGGGIGVESAPGRGTTVTVYLPATERSRDASPAPSDREDVSGTETVLLVDDDHTVRDVIAEMLAQQGYDVRTARTAEDAIDMAEQGLRPDVLVTDVVMPRISGPELAERLTRLQPGLQVILTSGYAEHELLETGPAAATRLFVHKPFSAEQLARAIREAVDR